MSSSIVVYVELKDAGRVGWVGPERVVGGSGGVRGCSRGSIGVLRKARSGSADVGGFFSNTFRGSKGEGGTCLSSVVGRGNCETDTMDSASVEKRKGGDVTLLLPSL